MTPRTPTRPTDQQSPAVHGRLRSSGRLSINHYLSCSRCYLTPALNPSNRFQDYPPPPAWCGDKKTPAFRHGDSQVTVVNVATPGHARLLRGRTGRPTRRQRGGG